jgi:putative ABC transport system permease protein
VSGPAGKIPDRGERFGWVAGLVGAVSEAWAELRIHRTRVLLSLIGVAVAVCALTTVVGLGAIVQQSTTESMERSSGRPAMLTLTASGTSGEQLASPELDAAFETMVKRYEIRYSSRMIWATMTAQFPDGTSSVDTQAVDVDYGVMHRVELASGRWFTDQDESRLAPALVVNQNLYKRLGSPDLRTHPTITLTSGGDLTAVVIGVTPAAPYEESPRAYLLSSVLPSVVPPAQLKQNSPSYELWVPPVMAKELKANLERDLRAALPGSSQVNVDRQDYLGYGGPDPLLPVRLVLGGVSVLVLLLGALGLVNISLVTLRQRIREIGIRRSFGATAGRVFFAVMMESVVATLVAGVIGVIGSILIVQNPLLRSLVGQGATDLPAFPIEAAVIGMIAAGVIGALAGLLPALVAVRVKVIDAIRY